MTTLTKELIELARECGFAIYHPDELIMPTFEQLQAFATKIEARQAEKLRVVMEALKNVTVHLIAAHSLLQRGGKKAAASDTIFKIMLDDYEKSFEVGRSAIAIATAEQAERVELAKDVNMAITSPPTAAVSERAKETAEHDPRKKKNGN